VKGSVWKPYVLVKVQDEESVEGHCWHEPSGTRQQTGDLSFLVCLSPPWSSSRFTHLFAEWGCPPDTTSLSDSKSLHLDLPKHVV